MHLSETQLQFLGRLGKSPDGQLLLGLLETEINETNVSLRKLSGEALNRAQGRAVYLDELVTMLTPKMIVQRNQIKRPIATDSFA